MTDLDSRRRDRVDYADYLSDAPTGHRRSRPHGVSSPYRGFGGGDRRRRGDGYASHPGPDAYGEYDTYGEYDDYGEYGEYGEYDDYPEYDTYDEYADDDDYAAGWAGLGHQWRPVAITAAVILVIALIATALILQGGGDGGTAGTVSAPPTRTVIATPPAPTTSLPAETVTSVPPPRPTTATPTPSAPATTTPPSATTPPPPATAPAPNPRTVTYRVTGTKPLLDLVTIVYTDEQGFPRTDVNVSLPWSRRVVLNPGVTVRSVAASSLRSELNCTITDAAGQLIAQSATNSILATCTL